MRKILTCSVILYAALCPGATRADDPISGPKVGETAPGFEVEVATGDEAGKTIDLLKTLKDKPGLLIFVGEMTRPAFGLLKVLDKYGRPSQPHVPQLLIVRPTHHASVA